MGKDQLRVLLCRGIVEGHDRRRAAVHVLSNRRFERQLREQLDIEVGSHFLRAA